MGNQIYFICGEKVKELPDSVEETDYPYDDFDKIWAEIENSFSSCVYKREFYTNAFPLSLFGEKSIELWFDSLVGDDHIYNSIANIWIFTCPIKEVERLHNILKKLNIPKEHAKPFTVTLNAFETALHEGWELTIGFHPA